MLKRPTPRAPHGKEDRTGALRAARSLREEVSRGVAEEHWYQNDDASGTMAMLSRLIFDEAATYLKKRGYDVTQLRKDAETVVKSYSIKINGGNFTDVNIATGNINQARKGRTRTRTQRRRSDRCRSGSLQVPLTRLRMTSAGPLHTGSSAGPRTSTSRGCPLVVVGLGARVRGEDVPPRR